MRSLILNCFIALSILVSFLHAPLYARETVHVYSRVDSFTYSQAMSIDGFINDFDGKLDSGSTAITNNVVEWGVSYHDWQIAKIIRYDNILKFTPDTAFINYQLERGIEIDLSRSYDIALNVEHLKSTGFKLQRLFQLSPNIRLSLGISYLESKQFYSGHQRIDLNAGELDDATLSDFTDFINSLEQSSIESIEDVFPLGEELQSRVEQMQRLVSSTNINADVDYYFYKPALREDEQERYSSVNLFDPSGVGFTMNLSMQWQFQPKWLLNITLHDFYSRIRWKNSPATQGFASVTQAMMESLAILNTFVEEDVIKRASGSFFQSVNELNPDDPVAGLKEKLAAIKLEHSRANVSNVPFYQQLPRRGQFSLQYQAHEKLSFEGSVYHAGSSDFYSIKMLGLKYFGLEYVFQHKAVGIGFESSLFYFNILTDSSDEKEAKLLGLNLGINLPI